MSVVAHLMASVGQLTLDVELQVADGEVLALLGPNGAGKTTVLRALAGLVPLAAGHIEIDGTVVDDPGRRLFVAPEARRVGFALQDYALFPSMSIVENVAFGLRARGVRKAAALAAAHSWLERMQLADKAGERPAALSGGQAQRVALARALAPAPHLLLLDEPLAALDATTRAAVRRDLSHHLASFAGPAVVVTHDPVDALALADRVAVVEDGRLVQQGTLADITAHPRSRYVADLVGLNLVRGVVAGGVLTTPTGATVVIADAADGPSWALIRPHSVVLSTEATPSTSVRNHWSGTVTGLDRLGDRVRVQLDGELPLTAEVTAAGFDALGLAIGTPVHAAAKATEIEVYPA